MEAFTSGKALTTIDVGTADLDMTVTFTDNVTQHLR